MVTWGVPLVRRPTVGKGWFRRNSRATDAILRASPLRMSFSMAFSGIRFRLPDIPEERGLQVPKQKKDSGSVETVFIGEGKKDSRTFDENDLLGKIRSSIVPLSDTTGEIGDGCLRLYNYWQIFRDFAEKTGLRHTFPFILLIVYSVLGATAFYYIETYQERQEMENWKMNETLHEKNRSKYMKQLALKILEIHQTARNRNGSWVVQEVEKQLQKHKDIMSNLRPPPKPEMLWQDFYNALFYAGTVYTTIGYGNIHPKTVNGQIMTMVYSLFGVPVMFLVLHKLGRLFCVLILRFWELYSWLKSKVCPRHRKHPTRHSNGGETGDEKYEEDGDDDDGEEHETRHLYDVPITLAITITLAWMLFSSALFLIWEKDWTYFKAFYFCFISLTTIGFGDVVPSKLDRMVMVFGVVIIGLSLVTMCINLIQVKLEHIFQETVLMILKKYQEAQAAGHDFNMPGGAAGVISLLQSNKKSSWLKGLLGRNKKEELVKEIESKTQMRSKRIQTDSLDVATKCAQVTTTMVSPPMLIKRDRATSSSDFSVPDYISIPESYMTHYFVSGEPFEPFESATDLQTPIAPGEFATVSTCGTERSLPTMLKSVEMPAKIYESTQPASHRMSVVSTMSDPNYFRRIPDMATHGTSTTSAKDRWALAIENVKSRRLDEFTELKSEIDKILDDCRSLVSAKDTRTPAYIPCSRDRRPTLPTAGNTARGSIDVRNRTLATKKASPSYLYQSSVMPSYIRRMSVLTSDLGDSNDNVQQTSRPTSTSTGTTYYTPPETISSGDINKNDD